MLLPPPPHYTPEFGNEQYDNGHRVPGTGDILARWKDQAAQARRSLSMRADLAYGRDAAESLDLFEGESGRNARCPVLVFIHGGYWRSMSKAAFSWIAPPFVAQRIKVAIVDYGLAPRVPMEVIVRQNVAAIAWIRAHAADLGIDRDRIVVAGHSAGGHLTAMMLAARWPEIDPSLPTRMLRGGVAISGLYDMEPLRHTPYLNADLQLTLDRVAGLSPLYMSPSSDAALITAVGGDESDEFKRHNREIGIAWASVLREDVPLPGDHHFSACERLAEPGHRLFDATMELLTG